MTFDAKTIMLMALAAPSALAQSGSSLVVNVQGDKPCHQPTCAVVARAGS